DSERLSLESHVVPASALHDLVPFPASGVFVTYRVLFPDVTHVYCPAFSLQPLRPVCTGPYRRFAGDTRPVTEFVPGKPGTDAGKPGTAWTYSLPPARDRCRPSARSPSVWWGSSRGALPRPSVSSVARLRNEPIAEARLRTRPSILDLICDTLL